MVDLPLSRDVLGKLVIDQCAKISRSLRIRGVAPLRNMNDPTSLPGSHLQPTSTLVNEIWGRVSRLHHKSGSICILNFLFALSGARYSN